MKRKRSGHDELVFVQLGRLHIQCFAGVCSSVAKSNALDGGLGLHMAPNFFLLCVGCKFSSTAIVII